MVLPRSSEIPESEFYCVECGPSRVGLDCDLPGHGEFGLLADVGADERGLRECYLCPPRVVRCAHDPVNEGRVVWIWRATYSDLQFGVALGNRDDSRLGLYPEACCWGFYDSSTEADAEFDRLELFMLGRES